MTTRHSDHEYNSSRLDQMSSGAATTAHDNARVEHKNNGQHENGYAMNVHDNQQMNFSQMSGNSSIASTGSKSEDERKLFVGGLTWDTTQDDLREYFSNFGNILDCSIKHDPSTGRSRGFAFLIFDSKDIVEKILSQNDHFVKGRKVDPKPAHRRLNATNNQINNIHNPNHKVSSQPSLYGIGLTPSIMPYQNMAMGVGANLNPSNNNRKVFIGGLDPNFSDSKLREYFSKFGPIDEIDLPYDKEKNERRPFCFISFQTEQAAQEVLRQQRHTIGDMSVDVKRAKPKTVNNSIQQQQQQQQQRQQHMYDPYGQVAYVNYGTGISPYGPTASYPTPDAYNQWNTYPYNQQGNPAAYQYTSSGSTGAPSPGPTSYQQYPEHQSNSQYGYAQPNTIGANDYYSQYEYGAVQSEGTYADPNTYAAGYDYASYYSPMNANIGSTGVDNGTAQQSGNQNDYEHDNHHGKAKTSIVSSPNFHPYSRSTALP